MLATDGRSRNALRANLISSPAAEAGVRHSPENSMTEVRRTLPRMSSAVALVLVTAWASVLSAALMPAWGQAGQSPAPGWDFRPVGRVSAAGPRVLLIYDMEGLAGIDRHEMTVCGADSAAYRTGQDRLVTDVNAVIDGLVVGGAKEIGVIDRHGGCESPARDLPTDRLDRRAHFVDETKASALAQPWDAVALVGMHAGPGSGGFLEHIGSFGIERILNGLSVTESEQFALRLGERGIPIVFASGDDRLGHHLASRMPWVVYVEVKSATSLTTASLRPAAETEAALRARAQAALRNRSGMKTLALVAPFSGGFRAVYPETLDPLAILPGLDVHVRNGIIPVTGTSAQELNQAISRVQSVVASFWWSEAFWEAAKTRPDIVRQADSLFMVRWRAGPPAAKPPR